MFSFHVKVFRACSVPFEGLGVGVVVIAWGEWGEGVTYTFGGLGVVK